jgi:hypothetical protein
MIYGVSLNGSLRIDRQSTLEMRLKMKRKDMGDRLYVSKSNLEG